MYLLESPQRGDSNKYPRRIFSKGITRDCQRKYTRSADFCAARIDVITNYAVITNVVIKRVQCSYLKSNIDNEIVIFLRRCAFAGRLYKQKTGCNVNVYNKHLSVVIDSSKKFQSK